MKRVEQISPELNILEDYDQPLRTEKMLNILKAALGNECSIGVYNGKKYLLYSHDNVNEIILVKAVTYLGHPHPIFKKRIQLDGKVNDVYNNFKNENFNVRLIGVYNYNGLIIFVDFDKEKYVQRKLNNSSAHVMLNDLYQSIKNGVFSKIDSNGNKITTISYNYLKKYIDGNVKVKNNLFELFAKFNYNFKFGEWITAVKAIEEMKNKKWFAWKETEWAGFFLEYKFNEFVDVEKCQNQMIYKGNIKAADDLDFDIYFKEQEFYGDLKASDIKKIECPANDQQEFIDAINKYDRFWYIIYEHNTIKDKDRNNEMAIERMKLCDIPYIPGEHISYATRMKHSVEFVQMKIIEFNRANFRLMMRDFNQGHQYDGVTERAPKFKIDKRNIDNFVVFSYVHKNNL